MNVQLIGINPKQEKKVSKFHARLIKGDFLKTDDDIVIGERLRKKLDVEVFTSEKIQFRKPHHYDAR